MQAEFAELAVEVEVEERAVGGGFDPWVQHASLRRDGGAHGVVCGRFDVGRVRVGRDAEDVGMAVDAQAGGLAMAGTGIAGKNEENTVAEGLD